MFSCFKSTTWHRDTLEDFNNSKNIYAIIATTSTVNYSKVLKYINDNPSVRQEMKKQINLNEK